MIDIIDTINLFSEKHKICIIIEESPFIKNNIFYESPVKLDILADTVDCTAKKISESCFIFLKNRTSLSDLPYIPIEESIARIVTLKRSIQNFLPDSDRLGFQQKRDDLYNFISEFKEKKFIGKISDMPILYQKHLLNEITELNFSYLIGIDHLINRLNSIYREKSAFKQSKLSNITLPSYEYTIFGNKNYIFLSGYVVSIPGHGTIILDDLFLKKNNKIIQPTQLISPKDDPLEEKNKPILDISLYQEATTLKEVVHRINNADKNSPRIVLDKNIENSKISIFGASFITKITFIDAIKYIFGYESYQDIDRTTILGISRPIKVKNPEEIQNKIKNFLPAVLVRTIEIRYNEQIKILQKEMPEDKGMSNIEKIQNLETIQKIAWIRTSRTLFIYSMKKIRKYYNSLNSLPAPIKNSPDYIQSMIGLSNICLCIPEWLTENNRITELSQFYSYFENCLVEMKQNHDDNGTNYLNLKISYQIEKQKTGIIGAELGVKNVKY